MNVCDGEPAEMMYEGGCACGGVRFRMLSAPLFVHCCHCRWCQRETGASFALNALIESDRVSVLSGEPEPTPTPSNSGKGQNIWRCPGCHVALWSNYAGFGDKVSRDPRRAGSDYPRHTHFYRIEAAVGDHPRGACIRRALLRPEPVLAGFEP